MNRKLFAAMTHLKAKQEAFCQAYSEDPNGAAGARAAGYAEGSAKQQAHRLLARPEIAGRLEELRLEAAEGRARCIDELIAKVEPVYDYGVAQRDNAAILEAVTLQARIAGLIDGRGRARRRRDDDPAMTLDNL